MQLQYIQKEVIMFTNTAKLLKSAWQPQKAKVKNDVKSKVAAKC